MAEGRVQPVVAEGVMEGRAWPVLAEDLRCLGAGNVGVGGGGLGAEGRGRLGAAVPRKDTCDDALLLLRELLLWVLVLCAQCDAVEVVFVLLSDLI